MEVAVQYKHTGCFLFLFLEAKENQKRGAQNSYLVSVHPITLRRLEGFDKVVYKEETGSVMQRKLSYFKILSPLNMVCVTFINYLQILVGGVT